MLETIRQRLLEIASDGRVSCADAWQLAEELGVSKADMGRAANEAGIKIKDCQLGCF
jgi:hypothetical protein